MSVVEEDSYQINKDYIFSENDSWEKKVERLVEWAKVLNARGVPSHVYDYKKFRDQYLEASKYNKNTRKTMKDKGVDPAYLVQCGISAYALCDKFGDNFAKSIPIS